MSGKIKKKHLVVLNERQVRLLIKFWRKSTLKNIGREIDSRSWTSTDAVLKLVSKRLWECDIVWLSDWKVLVFLWKITNCLNCLLAVFQLLLNLALHLAFRTQTLSIYKIGAEGLLPTLVQSRIDTEDSLIHIGKNKQYYYIQNSCPS